MTNIPSNIQKQNRLSIDEARFLLSKSQGYKDLIRDVFLYNKDISPDKAGEELGEIIGAVNYIDAKKIADMYISKILFGPVWSVNTDITNTCVSMIKAGFISKELHKKEIEKIIDICMDRAKNSLNYIEIYISMVEVGIIDKESYKNQINKLTDICFENQDLNILISMISLGIIDKESYKNQINKLADRDIKNHRIYNYTSMIKAGLIDKEVYKEEIEELANVYINKAKKDFWDDNNLYYMIESGLIDKEVYKIEINILVSIFIKSAESTTNYLYYIASMIKAGLIDKEVYKEEIEELANVYKNNNKDSYITMIKSGLIDKEIHKEEIEKIANTYIENAAIKSEYIDDYIGIIKAGLIDKESHKDQIVKLANICIEKFVHFDTYAHSYLYMIEVGIIDQESYKNQINKLADICIEKLKNSSNYANVYIKMVSLGLITIDSNYKLANHDIYQNMIKKYGIISKGLFTDHILDKSKLENIDKMLSMYPDNEQLLKSDKFQSLVKQNLDKFTELYSQKDHRGLLDHYISIVKKSEIKIMNDDLERYDHFMRYFGNCKEIEYYFLDSRRDKIRSIHDAMENFRNIIDISHDRITKGYIKDKQAFVSHILANVGQSNVGYEDFNNFLIQYNPNTLDNTKKLIDDKTLSDPEFIKLYHHIYTLNQNKQLYNQYGNLKLLLKLQQIIDNQESLQKISELSQSENPYDIDKYNYFRNGIFDPRSNSELFLQLLDNPKKFLSMDDGHAKNEIHESFKPIHFCEIDELKFSPNELVDSLIGGSLDKINYFQPLCIYYIIDDNQGIIGTVNDILSDTPTKQLSTIVVNYNNNNPDDKISFSLLKSGLHKLNTEQQKYIQNQLLKVTYPDKKLKVLLAQVLPKSDPSNWFNGVNCDKLADGNGKKIVQVMNPMSSEFTIYSGKKMLVNSRLTLNQQTDKNFSEIRDNIIENGDGLTFTDLPDKYIITADNVEAIGNHGLSSKLVDDIYCYFFTEYTRKYPHGPKNIPIKSDTLYIGSMHNKIKVGNNSIDNKSISVVPNSYTDNHGSDTSVLTLDNLKTNTEKINVSGVFPMGPEDIRNISTLEKESYASFGGSVGYAGMRNEILGSMVHQIHHHQENLSYVAYKDNKLVGYILAYESGDNIYVSDRNCKNPIQAMRLLECFGESLDKIDVNKTITMRSRDTTSLAIIRKMVAKKGRKIISEDDDAIGSESFTSLVISRK